MRSYLFSAALAILASATASASTLTVSTNSTFDLSAPVSPYSTPGGSYGFSFDIESTPTVSEVTPDAFRIPFSNFVYTLNGHKTDLSATNIEFVTSADYGLIVLCFSSCSTTSAPATGFGLDGDQAFAGSTSAPTILPGSYAAANSIFAVDGVGYEIPDSTLNITEDSTITPEPSTLTLLGTGLLGTISTFYRRRLS